MTDAERPQDVGRRHRRRGQPSRETAALLDAYQGAMRDELRGILDELAPRPPAAGLGLVQEPPQRPPLKERAALWDLAIKLGKELGSAIDAPPEAAAPSRPARPRRAAVDFG